jgi:uncharacterized UPF0160 family protein
MTVLRAITHSGSFHADEVTAYAILCLAIGKDRLDFARTRNPAVITQAEIVFDVGGVCDPDQGRFDHHMTADKAPRREDGGLYSSAGLIWGRYGRDALRGVAEIEELAIGRDDTDIIDQLWSRIDRSFIRQIDRVDTGEETPGPLSYADQIDSFNPNWNEAGKSDIAFRRASNFASDTLCRTVRRELAHILSRKIVLEAHAAGSDPEILELPLSLPWQGAVYENDLPVKFAVYPSDGDWMIAAMPTRLGGYDQRVPLPEEWAGLRNADLQAETGVDDAVFVHAARFCGAARSKEGALKMVNKTLDLTQSLNMAAGPG